jgi:excisionase family DNA binding protein
VNALVDELRLLSVEDLAEVCGTGTDWIEEALAARRYEFTMVGRRYRFTKAQAEAIIASKRVPAETAPTADEVAVKRLNRRRAA